MIWKTSYGAPLRTDAITMEVPEGPLRHFTVETNQDRMLFQCTLRGEDVVYGLGETMGRVNKRGGRYISFNTDTADHSDANPSLYSSHNVLIVDGEDTFGVFFDTPGRVVFEIDHQGSGEILVSCESNALTVYQLEGENAYAVSREFVQAIGRSYIPPLWAFGFCQSRFGYTDQQDFRNVIEGYQRAGIPLDSICMDIDYMDHFADFTVNPMNFPDLKAFVSECKEQGIHLVPIVDAGIKIEKGNEIYEEGVKNGYFCRNREGGFFQAAVWPGLTHFPDFLNPDARHWFGRLYRFYTDAGLEGFWNDMNEPAIFYSEYTKKPRKLNWILNFLFFKHRQEQISRGMLRDYRSFFHNVDGKLICHYDVHNLYGAMMTRATSEGLERLLDHRFLLFSRSSYIGAGRYGGLWTGDNTSCWEHLMLNLRHMPSLNMCGFLYSGADTGGFMGNCTRELLLRWLAVSVFTPLMRNHSGKGTRDQECYAFGDPKAFRSVVSLRYRLLPYIYSEYMKAALTGDLYIKPLAFGFPENGRTKQIEDQLLVGGSLMMTPIVQEGAVSRTVYLPEDMTMVYYDGEDFRCSEVSKGEIDIHVELDEVVFFVRKDALVPVGRAIMNTSEVDFDDLTLLGTGKTYELYADDGLTREYSLDNIRILSK